MKLLVYNPDNRITASQALKHPWFREIKEQELILKQQYAVTQQSVRANNFADSLSQYSKHSDELAMSDLATQYDKQSKISAIYSTKKHGHDKFGKTQKKLPDLQMGYYEGSKGRNMGISSDSDGEHNIKQLPMIKGGGNMQNMNQQNHNSQVSEAYSMKASGGVMKPNKHNSSFNQSKYLSNHSPSPSQTFFKGK